MTAIVKNLYDAHLSRSACIHWSACAGRVPCTPSAPVRPRRNRSVPEFCVCRSSRATSPSGIATHRVDKPRTTALPAAAIRQPCLNNSNQPSTDLRFFKFGCTATAVSGRGQGGSLRQDNQPRARRPDQECHRSNTSHKKTKIRLATSRCTVALLTCTPCEASAR